MSDALICPACGRYLESYDWMVQGRWYCDELCGKRARHMTFEEQTREE